MDWDVFLVVLIGTLLVSVSAVVILLSVYANQDIPTTLRQLRRAFFEKFDLPPADLDPTLFEEEPQKPTQGTEK